MLACNMACAASFILQSRRSRPMAPRSRSAPTAVSQTAVSQTALNKTVLNKLLSSRTQPGSAIPNECRYCESIHLWCTSRFNAACSNERLAQSRRSTAYLCKLVKASVLPSWANPGAARPLPARPFCAFCCQRLEACLSREPTWRHWGARSCAQGFSDHFSGPIRVT